MLDWFLEITLYGFGGGLLGLLLALLIITQLRFLTFFVSTRMTVAAFTIVGFVAGALGRERGVEWCGAIIRRWEER